MQDFYNIEREIRFSFNVMKIDSQIIIKTQKEINIIKNSNGID